MDDNNVPKMTPEHSLPRPVVLRPEDLAAVAAAGVASVGASLVPTIVIRAGGIPAGPVLA